MARQEAIFAAGCFWGVEAAFKRIHGVLETEVGYSGGTTEAPTYEQVCSGATGHAEAVRLAFDPDQVSYETLVEAFFQLHDPTQLNRQGPDFGTQYRSAIFTLSPEQAESAEAVKARLEAQGRFPGPIVTEITPAGPFTRAEDYHQDYFAKRGRLGGMF